MALSSLKVSIFSRPSSKVSIFSLSSSTVSSSSSLSLAKARGRRRGFMVKASSEANSSALTGVIFEPFKEIKKEVLAVPMAPQVSMARHNYEDECQAAINEQIKWVLPIFLVIFSSKRFFKESSEEEREHAEKLMKFQNIRGGRVSLHPIKNPPSDFQHVEKGDALYAMELALSLEKLTNEKLLNVHSVADHNNDSEMAHFIESEFLYEQVEAIKKIAEYVAQLRMVGKGHGVWHFDQRLLHHA